MTRAKAKGCHDVNARCPRAPRDGERGFTIVELLIAVALIGVLMAIAIPELIEARTRAEVRAVTAEGRTIHSAFKEYFLDNGTYPSAMHLATFAPLTNDDYYRGGINSKLMGKAADAYNAPGDDDQEFFLEMTLERDGRYRFLVADSNDSTLTSEHCDGIWVFMNGVRLEM